MIVYHSSYLIIEKPNHQICILNQRLIDKYLKYLRTEEV